MSSISYRCSCLWLPLTVMLWAFCACPAKSVEPWAQVRTTSPDLSEALAAAWGEPPQASSEKSNHKNGNGDDKNGNDDAKGPEHIKDNSFLVEEAYNQDAGVVQHIMTWDTRWTHQFGHRRDFTFVYVMELPICSHIHQFSFTPLAFEEFSDKPNSGVPEKQGGIGDIFLNYRCQLLDEDANGWQPAVAPRVSLILPTGDESRSLGTGALGYQFNLPISKQLDPFAFHFNAGFTYTPGAPAPLLGGVAPAGADLHGYNLGASIIWLASYEVNFLLECVALWNEDFDDFALRDRTTEVVLNPGVRYAAYTDDSVQWVLGISAPLGLSRDAPDYGVFFYLSVEHSFLKKEGSK